MVTEGKGGCHGNRVGKEGVAMVTVWEGEFVGQRNAMLGLLVSISCFVPLLQERDHAQAD